MIRTYLIPLLAIGGVILAIFTVVKGSRPPEAKPPVIVPPTAPYRAFVAGSGLVEASTQNIAVGTAVPGVAEQVNVQVGQSIKVGDVLFRLESRELGAQLSVQQSQIRVAESQLAKLRMGTRPEQIPAVRARVVEAENVLKDFEKQYEIFAQVTDSRAVSIDETSRRRFAVETARARLEVARSELALLESGTWAPDIAVAEAQVENARASARMTETEIDRRVVRSPIEGRVLQVNLRVGEFAQAGPLQTPLMVVGTVDPLHVRVDVDEHDAWRVQAGARATAFVRGNKDITTVLEFVRFEPYVIPKRSLTGESTERVDTRVLQVVYRFDPKNLPIYVGQQMDVYIESAEGIAPGAGRTDAGGGGK